MDVCLVMPNSMDILILLVSSFPPGWGGRSGVVLSCGCIGFFGSSGASRFIFFH